MAALKTPMLLALVLALVIPMAEAQRGQPNRGRGGGDGAPPLPGLDQQGPGNRNPGGNIGAVAPDGDIDAQLRQLIGNHNLDGDPLNGRQVPVVDSPLVELGRTLFFSKSLGGDFDSACVSCHHPLLGGGDNLSLPVGVGAVNPNLLGPGREHERGLPLVPRNSPTVFNSILYNRGLFWDSRVERLPRNNGAGDGGIRTPDTPFGQADPNAGANLLEAQSRFPVTSVEEMKGAAFEAQGDNDAIRQHLAERLGSVGIGEGELVPNLWPEAFQRGFDSTLPPEELVTYASIGTAIGAYEASMVFVDNPWNRYVRGDLNAITEQQKQGARLFFGQPGQGGAGCVNCHRGDRFTDQRHHNVGFPQFGPGKGDGDDGAADYGRARESDNEEDRFDFRTPSLLNVAVTAPYGHAGAYESLQEVVRHYDNPRGTVNRFFNRGGACALSQYAEIADCEQLYPSAGEHSNAALDNLEAEQQMGMSLLRNVRLNNAEVGQLVTFLRALTDPCVESRSCLAPWIAPVTETGPDGEQLNAVGEGGDLL